MDTEVTGLIIEELGQLLPRNQIIEDVCLKANLKWAEAELLVTLVESERAHSIVRKQGPRLIAVSIVLMLVGIVPFALALYFVGMISGFIPLGGGPGSVEIEIPIPIPLSSAGLAEGMGECLASFTLLSSGIIGVYDVLRRYRET